MEREEIQDKKKIKNSWVIYYRDSGNLDKEDIQDIMKIKSWMKQYSDGGNLVGKKKKEHQ